MLILLIKGGGVQNSGNHAYITLAHSLSPVGAWCVGVRRKFSILLWPI